MCKAKYHLLLLISAILVPISWFLNMGWFRFLLTFLTLPYIHFIVFIIINNISISKLFKSEKLKKYILLSCVTYISAYLLFPDVADIGEAYVFFGLIENDTISYESGVFSILFCIWNIAILIMEIIEIIKLKSCTGSNKLFKIENKNNDSKDEF